MLKEIKILSVSRHESAASTMRYIMEKGLNRDSTENLIIKATKEIVSSGDDTDKKLKYLLFKSIIRLDSIAQKMMDKDQFNRDINDHKILVKNHEKDFCEKVGIEV